MEHFKRFLRNYTLPILFGIAATAALAAVTQYPLILSSSPQPNIMILLDNSVSMQESVDGKEKMQSARTVISNLVKAFPNVRFGLAVFNPFSNTASGLNADGGKIVMPCGTLTAANVDATVNGISANSVTPLGETLAEIWQYFKGEVSSYNSGVSYTSPITLSCQKSFTIIVTDGEPTADNHYKGDFASYGWDSNDNVNLTTTHLADVAKYMFEHPAKAGFAGSFISTYTVGFSVSSATLQQTALNGGGEYFTAANEAALSSTLQTVVSTIIGTISSASSVALNTAYLNTSAKLYRARLDSRDWSGYLEAFGLQRANGDIVGYPGSPLWEAGQRLNGRTASRVIYTAASVSGTYKRLPFETASQPTLSTAGFTNFSTNWISYVRGELSPLPAGYRSRTNKLGDMLNSPPVVYGAPSAPYDDADYLLFKKNKSTRKNLILAGANDGMLHAFNVDTGDEEWAFIPMSLLRKLKFLRSKPYSHMSYVDGVITVADAYITSKNAAGTVDVSPAWHSIAVGGLRAGAKSFFALDITDPDNPIPLWELAASSANGLGYSFGTPLVLKVKDASRTEGYRWVAALSNGYEGTVSGKAATLIIADLGTGAIIRELVADTATFTGVSPNGLSSPAAVDVNADGFAEYVYAGDLKGQLYKFDLTGGAAGGDTSKWSVAPIFAAKDPSGVAQPITTTPEVVLRGDHQIVFIGTGKYLEETDKTSTQIQSFYGIYDRNVNNPKVFDRTDAQMTQQTLTLADATWRVSSTNAIGTKGWYIDLNMVAGERVIVDPVARSRKIIFTTFIPSTNPCSAGGVSWLIELRIDTGGTIIKPAFDVNNDKLVDGSDVITVGGKQVTPTGTLLGEGIASTPAIIGTDQGLEYKFISRSTGEITKLLEGGGTGQFGPRSWRSIPASQVKLP